MRVPVKITVSALVLTATVYVLGVVAAVILFRFVSSGKWEA